MTDAPAPQSPAPEADGAVRLRLDLAYDGAAFSGWARQPGLRTVQGALEDALATVFARTGPPPLLTVAGRTDAGVHASAQVAHLDLTGEQWASLDRPRRPTRRPSADSVERTPLDGLVRRLNGLAGPSGDVVVHRTTVAPDGFDARFAPLWRRYEYRVADALAPHDPLRRGHTLWHQGELDATAMTGAALVLLGLHDFATFCKPREGATTIRTLQEFRWERDAEGVLVAHLRADAFCHSMVRAMVGATIAVGEGRLTADDLDALRRAERRTSDVKVAPAKGLTLVGVGYPPDDELRARVERTRARRDAVDASPGAGVAGPADDAAPVSGQAPR